MPTGRSFAEYVKGKCYDGLYDAAAKFAADNYRLLELRLRKVRSIESVELLDADIKRVYVRDLPGMRVAFEVGLELDVEVKDSNYKNDEGDECFPWIRISCEGDLSCGLDDWQITKIEPYNPTGAPMNSLSDALVPYMPYEHLEDEATKFLKEYYPEALAMPRRGETPVTVEPEKLAERLGLTVQLQRIREDASVFGQLYFVDTDAELYDAKAEETKVMHISGKTILVDPQMFLLRNLGSVNNTIIHECVHWVKHRKVFELEKLYNADAASISCEVVGGAAASVAKQATELMERQANQLTPRIQMPAGPFKAKAAEYIATFMHQANTVHTADVMEQVITALQRDFGVSKQAAKIRLVEVGFDEAIGTYTFLDGHYVKPHAFRKGSIQVNQTFSISAQDAAIERFTNPDLRKITDSGDYLFIDNHFVYNAPLYVERDENGKLDLTGYARSHMDECCLVFDLHITSKVSSDYHTACFLNRESSDITFELKFHNKYEYFTQEKQAEYRQKQQEEAIAIRKQMTDDPEQCMELLLGWRGMNYTDLGNVIGMAPRTISRTVQGKTKPKVETAALICFGMNLPPVISEKLMEVLGCKLSPINPTHQWINEALHVKYPEPVYAVAEYLASYGVDLGVDDE